MFLNVPDHVTSWLAAESDVSVIDECNDLDGCYSKTTNITSSMMNIDEFDQIKNSEILIQIKKNSEIGDHPVKSNWLSGPG